ncbi:MAG: hypothetical protein R6V01_01305 [Thermoplasmatota archaeon]
MILDLPVQMVFVPFLLLAGLSLVVYGKEILEVLSFPIGAVTGGILAYMIFKGLLLGYDIPFLIVLLFSAALVIGGGFLGKGTLAMLLGLFASIVLVDVVAVFIGPDTDILLMVIGLILFLAMVPFTQKFMTVFAAFVGGVSVAMGITPFLDGLGTEAVVRVVQMIIILVLCAVGAVAQHFIMKKIAARKEEITWVPTGSNKSAH